MGTQWRGDALLKAGLVDDAICPFCREASDKLRHRWWQCPDFEHIRGQDPELDDLCRECPPPD
eukprot:11183122-Lingulodinium_polyedra.AAC.1